jgi:hypothetical protein
MCALDAREAVVKAPTAGGMLRETVSFDVTSESVIACDPVFTYSTAGPGNLYLDYTL